MEGKPGAKLEDFPEYILMANPPQSTPDANTTQMNAAPFKLPSITAHIFYSLHSCLAALKAAASSFSTNDALNTLVWRHMTIARNSSVLLDGEKDCVMLYTANIRSRMNPPLPTNYLGSASIGSAKERLKVSALLGDSGLWRILQPIALQLWSEEPVLRGGKRRVMHSSQPLRV